MAIQINEREKDVQKDVEKKLEKVTAAYLKGYIKLANGNGRMEVNPQILEKCVLEYAAEVAKGTSLAQLDEKGKPVTPNVFMDEEGIHINEYTIEILPFDEFAKGKYVNNVYEALEEEHDYMSHILYQIKIADKMAKAQSKEPVKDESIVENANNARTLALQEDAAKQIAIEEACMGMGTNLARTITKKMLAKAGIKDVDEKIVGRDGVEYSNIEELISDLKIQSIQTSNRAIEAMREEGYKYESLSLARVDEAIKNDPSIVTKYPSLIYEYNDKGQPRSYKEVKKIIINAKQYKIIDNPKAAASYDELLTDVSIRIIEREYRSKIEKGANEIEAYDAVIEEIGEDNFEVLIPEMEKYMGAEKSLEQATSLTPQLNQNEIVEAVQRMAPIKKKTGEEIALPEDIFEEYKQNGEALIDEHEKKEQDEPTKEDTTLKDILERLTQIREEQQRAIEEQKDKEPNIRIDPNVFVNVNNSKKDKNVDKHKIININIDRSKHIDNSDHSVHNHYDEKDKDKDTEEPKDYHGKDGKDGSDGNNGSNGNDGKNGKNGKDGKEPEPIAPEPPKVEPVTIVEPIEKPKKEPKETEPIQPEPVDPIIDPTIIGVGGKQEVEKPKEDKPIEKPEDEVQKQDEEPKVEENTKDNPNVVINGDVHIHNGDNNVTQINEDIDITQNNIEINNIEEQNNNTIHVHYHDGRPDEVIDITEDVEPVQKEMDVIEAEVIEQPQIEGEELKQLPYGGETIEQEEKPNDIDPAKIALEENFMDCATAIFNAHKGDLNPNEYNDLVASYEQRVEDGSITKEDLEKLKEKAMQKRFEVNKIEEKLKSVKEEEVISHLDELEKKMEEEGYLKPETKEVIAAMRKLVNDTKNKEENEPNKEEVNKNAGEIQ